MTEIDVKLKLFGSSWQWKFMDQVAFVLMTLCLRPSADFFCNNDLPISPHIIKRTWVQIPPRAGLFSLQYLVSKVCPWNRPFEFNTTDFSVKKILLHFCLLPKQRSYVLCLQQMALLGIFLTPMPRRNNKSKDGPSRESNLRTHIRRVAQNWRSTDWATATRGLKSFLAV